MLLNPYRFVVSGGGGGSATTWDPTKKGSAVTLSGGDLVASATSGHAVLSTSGKTTGKWYFEILIGSQADNYGVIGLATATQSLITGANLDSINYRGNGSVAGIGSAGAWTAGDVVGFAFDIGGSAFEIFLNGASALSGTRSFPSEVFPAAGDIGGAPSPHMFTLRPNAASQSYAPPSGYSPYD